MASKIKVDQIEGSTASTITLPSGQTLDLSSGSLTLPDGAVDLSTAKVTGTIPVSKGGTGITSLGTALQALRVIGAANFPDNPRNEEEIKEIIRHYKKEKRRYKKKPKSYSSSSDEDESPMPESGWDENVYYETPIMRFG